MFQGLVSLQKIHEKDHCPGPKMARGIFPEILPICRPNPTQKTEETTEDRALVQ